MPQLFDPQSQSWVDVAPELTREALQSGRLTLEPQQQQSEPGFVSMVAPDGGALKVPEAEAQEFLALGARPETEEETVARRREEYFGDRGLEAFGAGAARGLTFGLSDVVGARLGGPGARIELQGLKEENIGASVGGEITGAVLPTLLTGGTSGAASGGSMLARGASAAARGAGALPRGVARMGLGVERAIAGSSASLGRKVLGKAAGSAAEGALYGGGTLVSEMALADDPVLTADKVISTVGLGALVGGAAGGAFGLGEEAARAGLGAAKSALAEKFSIAAGDDFSTVVGRLSDKQAAKSLGATKSTLQKVARGPRYGGDTKKANQVIGNFLREARDELDGQAILGRTVNETSKNLDTVAQATGSRIDDTVKQLDGVRGERGITGKKLADRLKQEVLDDETFKLAGEFVPNELKAMQRVIDMAESYGDAPMPFAQANVIKRTMQEGARFGRKTQSPMAQAFRKASRITKNEIEDQARAISKELGDQLAESNKTYSILSDARELAEAGIDRFEGNRGWSLTDNMYTIGGGLAAGSVGFLPGLAGAAAMGTVNNLARKRGNAALSKVLGAIEKASRGADDRASKSVRALLGTGKKAGKITGVSGKLVYKGGREASKSAAAEAARSGSGQRVVAPASSKLLDLMTRDEDQPKAKTLREQVKALRGLDPQTMADRIQERLGAAMDLEPAMSGAMIQRAMAATQFLQSKLPRNPNTGKGLMPQEWTPSPAELRTLERYVRAIDDPLSVIEDAADNKMTREGVEALRAVYPNLYNDLVSKIHAEIETAKEPPPYSRRASLSLLLGQPFDNTFEPRYVAAMQSSYQPQPQPSARGSMGGGGQMSLASNSQTEGQRLLEG